ncbi:MULTISPECIES: LppX_LprAFG lipoprotein [Thermomonosporaceae]|uniref:LppX_LprAFG lipoprotein n=1 Tax=Thermomonosporaceae TaxID=2012 RepID=UPI00255B1154|nr:MULTISPECIES: hypothetical protein [Thermomonosporaceae]MDL4776322.1 hypothetical protein [Actinomadura xylanilytica]
MIRRFVVGTTVATGLALSLTGCLGEAGDKVGDAGENIRLSAAQVLGKTAEKTGQTDTFQADMSMKASAGGMGSIEMNGSMQYRTKPELAYSMNFDRMSMGGKSMSGMRQVFIGRTMYMKSPALGQAGGTPGKPWLKISLDQAGEKSGMNLDQLLQQSRQMDPVQSTKLLTASKDVRKVGEETVDGVKTTHYTGTYQMTDAIAKLPADQQEVSRKALTSMGMGSMAFDLWVDGEQLPRKMAMKSQGQNPMSMTMKYRDYGKPVQITAPPADQVTDFAAMMKGLGGAGGAGLPAVPPARS